VNSCSRTISLAACGRGTTLVSEPALGSLLDLGPQFSQSVCRRTFLLTNAGRRHQSLVWSSEGFPVSSKSSASRRQTASMIHDARAGKTAKSKVDDTALSICTCLFSVKHCMYCKHLKSSRSCVFSRKRQCCLQDWIKKLTNCVYVPS